MTLNVSIKFDENKMPLQTIPYTYWKNLYLRCFKFHSNNPTDREYLHVLKAMWDMAEWFQVPGKNFPEVSEITYDYIMYDQGNSPQDQLPDVMMMGAKKYGSCNWAKTMSWSRLVGAYLRHGFAIYNKARFDTESGLFHASHMLANYVMLQCYVENNLPTDDRPWMDVKPSSLDPASLYEAGYALGQKDMQQEILEAIDEQAELAVENKVNEKKTKTKESTCNECCDASCCGAVQEC